MSPQSAVHIALVLLVVMGICIAVMVYGTCLFVRRCRSILGQKEEQAKHIAFLTQQLTQCEILSARILVAIKLGEMGWVAAPAIPELTAIAHNETLNPVLREHCIQALMMIGPPAERAIETLEQILKHDRHERVRKAAGRALSTISIAVAVERQLANI